MFLAFWIGWALVGLAIAVFVFAWAIKSRQFEQSRKAALLPFDDVEPESAGSESLRRSNLIIVVTVIIIAIILVVVMLALSMQHL